MNHTCNKPNCTDADCMYKPKSVRVERISLNHLTNTTERGEWDFRTLFSKFAFAYALASSKADQEHTHKARTAEGERFEEMLAFITRTIDAERAKAKAEERERMEKLLPVIEVIRDLEQPFWSLKYKLGNDYVQTVKISDDVSEAEKLNIVLKVVASANEAWTTMTTLTDYQTNLSKEI